MVGIVYDRWMGPSEEEQMNVAATGLATLELLLTTQFVPKPTDEKKQIIKDLARMELKDLKFLDQFGNDFMSNISKDNLTNDSTQKISFMSKLPGNLGDLIMKDLEVQGKKVEQTYWIDLLFQCQEKVKYLCWQKKAQDFSRGLEVCCSKSHTAFQKV